MFPIIPVLAATALGGGAYLLLHKDSSGPAPAKPTVTPAVLPPAPKQGTPQPAIPQMPIPQVGIPPFVAPPGPNPLPAPPPPPVPIPGVVLPPEITAAANTVQPFLPQPAAPPPPIVLPTAVEPVSGMTATVLGTPGANLRGAPSTSAAILAGLVHGTKVKIIDPIPAPPSTGAPKGWLKVLAPTGQSGFMSAEFLQIDGAPAVVATAIPAAASIPGLPQIIQASLPAAPTQFGNATVLGNPGLNMRSAPSTSGAIKKGLFSGTRVQITGNRLPPTTGAPQGWFPIQTPDGMSGFASAEFLRVDSTAGFAGEGRRRWTIQG